MAIEFAINLSIVMSKICNSHLMLQTYLLYNLMLECSKKL